MNKVIELIENNLGHKDGLEYVEKEIKVILLKISNTKEIKEAELFFKQLEEIQFVLAKSLFKYEVEVTPFLREFVYDYDRLDDLQLKETLYNRIKSSKS